MCVFIYVTFTHSFSDALMLNEQLQMLTLTAFPNRNGEVQASCISRPLPLPLL